MSHSLLAPCGRLLIATIASPTSEAEASQFSSEIAKALSKLPKGGIFATDTRGCQVVAPAVADAYIRLMRDDNKYVVRAGLLLAGHGNFSMQMIRLLKETGTNNRKLFYEPATLAAWLSEVLEADELAAVHKYFGVEGAPRLKA